MTMEIRILFLPSRAEELHLDMNFASNLFGPKAQYRNIPGVLIGLRAVSGTDDGMRSKCRAETNFG
ncbi:hypothetical protein FP026_19210 [Rhizobium tropici]|uniref:Uncharacterized protein n=1 Tax=Rhizobium tropici TaxID=398 RepID=A0A5B0VVP5_RHITR|nr:hypothetical protein [Rhizobium tropici]KAA1178597.1 hypothetical protein FP026_19210 [Rhizobium tropici]